LTLAAAVARTTGLFSGGTLLALHLADLSRPCGRRRGASGVHVSGGTMISVTRLKGQVVALNPDLIESVEENPDTTIRLISGEKLLVRESLSEVVTLVAEYRRYILSALSVHPLSGGIALTPSQRPQPSKG
jgi:uncharacterized protein YlzI (FlbEa/FlbD family)